MTLTGSLERAVSKGEGLVEARRPWFLLYRTFLGTLPRITGSYVPSDGAYYLKLPSAAFPSTNV
jgi:hypothetical protein